MRRNTFDAVLGRGGSVGDVEILGDAAAAGGVPETMNYQENREYTKGYRIDFGLGKGTVIAPGATVSFDIKTTTPFRPEEFVIPSELCPGLVVTELKVMDRDYVDGDGIPASLYSEVSTREFLKLPTINPSDKARISITNTNAVPVSFWAAFRGRKVTI